MEKIEHPLSKAQRKELENIVSTLAIVGRAVLFIVFTVVAGALFRSLQHLVFSFPPLWIIPTMAVTVWLYIRSRRWTGGIELRRQVKNDLAAGVAATTVIDPLSVVEVEELEDEGPSFIVETSTNDTVLLAGQEMDKYKRKKFPWAKFGVIEAPQSKQFFGLKKMGEPISIKQTISPLSYDQARNLGCFDHTFAILDEEQKRILRKIY